jgi:small-conductance mechanosensitive channel
MNQQTTLEFLKLYLPFVIAIGSSIALGVVIYYLIYRALHQYFAQRPQGALYNFFHHMKGPLALILPLIFINTATAILDLSRTAAIIELIIKLLLITVISWSLLKLIDYSDIWVITKQRENFNRIAARFYLLKRVAKIIITFLAVSLFLTNFEAVRELGKGLLLSASVAGGIILFAAQGIFGNIISGFQLAFTQPLNIGDELFIKGEFGTVEEVSLTNVVVRLWDLRRLVVPSRYFIDNPYENWAHPNRDLIGTVFLYTDYNVEIEKVRAELYSAYSAPHHCGMVR